MKLRLGRYVYGLGGIAFGVITLIWHQIDALGNISHPGILVYSVGVAELIGGLAIQWQKTVRFGALALSAIFSIFAIYWIPQIVKTPLIFGTWGNFGEQFSIVAGGVIVVASTLRSDPVRAATIARAAYGSFGICVISYAFYQFFYLTYTAELVPKWIPPGQMFWAIATTVAFALAAVALLSGRLALLASRLLTATLILFGLLVWLPLVFSDPQKMSNWTEFAATLGMAASSWIVADFLSQPNMLPRRWLFVRLTAKQEEGT
jgi:hypothetical protein